MGVTKNFGSTQRINSDRTWLKFPYSGNFQSIFVLLDSTWQVLSLLLKYCIHSKRTSSSSEKNLVSRAFLPYEIHIPLFWDSWECILPSWDILFWTHLSKWSRLLVFRMGKYSIPIHILGQPSAFAFPVRTIGNNQYNSFDFRCTYRRIHIVHLHILYHHCYYRIYFYICPSENHEHSTMVHIVLNFCTSMHAVSMLHILACPFSLQSQSDRWVHSQKCRLLLGGAVRVWIQEDQWIVFRVELQSLFYEAKILRCKCIKEILYCQHKI